MHKISELAENLRNEQNQSNRTVRLDEPSVQSPETTEFKSAQSGPIDYSTEPNQTLFEPSVPKNQTSTPFQAAATIASSSKLKLMSRRLTPRNSSGTTPRGSPSRIHTPFQSPRRAISAANSPMMTEASPQKSPVQLLQRRPIMRFKSRSSLDITRKWSVNWNLEIVLK